MHVPQAIRNAGQLNDISKAHTTVADNVQAQRDLHADASPSQ